jgi:hypothetical protein
MTTLAIITTVVASCISFVCGGLYFSASAAAQSRARSPQRQKIQDLLDRVGIAGAAVVSDDGGKTLVVVTCHDGTVQKVRLYAAAGCLDNERGELWRAVGCGVVEHVLDPSAGK